MDVYVIQSQKYLSLSETSVKDLVKDFTVFAQVDYDEVSIHFVDTQTISDLHAQFFDDPSPTDCITFPMDAPDVEGYRMMGDVFVCPETAAHFVKDHGGDVYQEITLYVIHGLLHLLGYDDIQEDDEKAMRAAEKEYLARVEKCGLWLRKSSRQK